MRKIFILVVALVLLAGLLVIPGVGDRGKVLATGNTVTVTVLQRNDGPVQNATVAMRTGLTGGGSLIGTKNTDVNGQAQWTLGDGDYTCLVSKTPTAGTACGGFPTASSTVPRTTCPSSGMPSPTPTC